MTTPMTMPVVVTGPRPIPTVPTRPTGPAGGRGGCSNCGSVRSVRVLPDGRHRCDCGHRWTPAPQHATPRAARNTTGHGTDGAA